MSSQTLADKTRGDFPLLSKSISEDKQLIYLDHAATSQKPCQVINSLNDYYCQINANVHRGAHQLSAKATEAFEGSREIVQNFVRARSSKEIIFTRNATEGINLIARSWGELNLKKDDEILLTIMEHHSNLIPWQLLAKRTGCVLRYVKVTLSGEFDLDDFYSKLNQRTKLVSLVHISNTLGCSNPIQEVADLAHSFGSLVLVDACQSLAHQPVDVSSLGVDFLVGSSHKLCGPTGVGFLWGREDLLDKMPPFLGGGEMIQDVFLDHFTPAEIPHKFEAGTPPIGEAIAMGSAIQYLESIGLENIKSWETILLEHLFEKLQSINGLNVLGPTPSRQMMRGALAAFSVENTHPNDIAALLDLAGICIRSGHHCCQPLHRYYGLSGTARVSLSFTSTTQEIDCFIDELSTAISFLKKNA